MFLELCLILKNYVIILEQIRIENQNANNFL